MTPSHPSDPPLRTGWLPEGPFSYTDEGDGEALVALHGLPGSVRDYRWLATATSGVRLVRIEQPGFGGTPRATEGSVSLAARARFVARAIDAIGLDRFAVLGHSMGGPLAMQVAGAAGDRAQALVLLSSVGLHPHRLMRKIGRRPDLRRALDARPVARLLLPVMRRGFARAGFPASTPDEAILQCMRIFSTTRFSEVRAAAASVRCETFVAWAKDDPLVEEAIGMSLASALPAGPRLAFEDGGHNIQKTRAVELGRAIGEWLSRPGCAASAP